MMTVQVPTPPPPLRAVVETSNGLVGETARGARGHLNIRAGRPPALRWAKAVGDVAHFRHVPRR